ncbi:MAG: TIR domain-containing protein [Gammaproteobacteria bacterium]|nr:TIR domain-containing protein [Gammaproteobacteria bacterium]NNC56085.1 TIR domain-containing protein [Woeseiaceae bacterium]
MSEHPNSPVGAYDGDESYIFVCYSHRDTAAVYSEIRRLQDMDVNVWYDEGIDAGLEWTDRLADAISGCSTFLYFVSPASVASEHCRREVSFANHVDVAVTAVHLSPTELPGGLQLSLGNRQGIMKHELTADAYRKKLAKALKISFSDAEESNRGESTREPVTTSDSRQSILVLPFVSRSRKDDADFICEGIADEITIALSSIDVLRVISGAAVRQLDIRNTSLRDLGSMLNVHYVLEGSVQMAGEKMRITARLPNIETGEVLWASKWDGSTEDIFDVQDSIALGVLDALKIQLSATQSEQLTERPIADLQAYEYFLRARQSVHEWTEGALKQALEYLQSGEDIIGENTYIISARGYIYWQFHNLGIDPDPRHLEKAQECIDQLFALDQDSPEGHRLSGLVKIMQQGEIRSVINHLKIALEARPNDTDALFWLAQVYGVVGRVSSGLALAQRLLKLDPITPSYKGLPAVLYMMDGNSKRAAVEFGQCHKSDPENTVITLLYGQALVMDGQRDEAIRVFSELGQQSAELFFANLARLYICCLNADENGAAEEATASLLEASRSDPQWSWLVAQCYALLGKHDEAVDWVANAVSHGFWNYPLLVERDAVLGPIRQHEGFQSVKADLHDKWTHLEA